MAAELPAAVRGMVGGELLAVAAAVQETTNALSSCGQAAVAELDRQGTWESMGFTSTVKLLADQLRVRPAEAHRRVALARDAAARVGLDGQVLPPLLPRVAAAQAAGVITPDHASVICGVFHRLPRGIAVAELDVIEAALVKLAGVRPDRGRRGRPADGRPVRPGRPRTPRRAAAPPPVPERVAA